MRDHGGGLGKERTSAWGGLVPEGLGPSAGHAQEHPLEPHVEDPAAGPVPIQSSPAERALDKMQELTGLSASQLSYIAAMACTPAELAALQFANQAEIQDDVGAKFCLSYGVINPNAFPVFVAFQGGQARPGAGQVEVPKEKAMIIPVSVTGHIVLGVKEGEKGSIIRLKFHTVQAFFVGNLA